MRRVTLAFLWLVALVNLAWGVWALFAPAAAGELLRFAALEPRAFGELRAVYGGLVGALGVIMGLALYDPSRRVWLMPIALGFFGLASGRLVSLVFEGPNTYTLLALVFEGLVGLACLRSAREARPRASSAANAPSDA